MICDRDCFNCKFPDCILPTAEAATEQARPKDPRGEILRAGRIAAGYKTATALAEAMGTKPKDVKAWEAGRSWPRGKAAAKLHLFVPGIKAKAAKAKANAYEQLPAVKARRKCYGQTHKEAARRASAAWREAHPERAREVLSAYRKRRYAEDIDWAANLNREYRRQAVARYHILG